MNGDVPQLLTTKDVKRLLRVGVGTIKKLTAIGALPKVRLGTFLRYRLSDVERLIANHFEPASLSDITIAERRAVEDDRTRLPPPDFYMKPGFKPPNFHNRSGRNRGAA